MWVLSVIQKPEGGAAYGKAETFHGHLNPLRASREAAEILIEAGVPGEDADRFGAYDLWPAARKGISVTHDGTGLTFRIDEAENAPHSCPCEDGCGRLVLPTDHPYADAEDAFCPGCFTWDRNTPACLPGNTAHAKRP